MSANAMDLSRQHLQAELRRIDVLIRREVRRWQLAGRDPTDGFRGLYLSDEHATQLIAPPFGAARRESAVLPPEETASFAEAERLAAEQAASIAQQARQQGTPSHLDRLAMTFSLDRFEVNTLLLSLTPTFNPRYEAIYGYLQDDVTRKRPSANLVLDLLCESNSERLVNLSYFADDASLFRHRLIERLPLTGETPSLSQPLHPDAAVVAWLLGSYRPRVEMQSHTRLVAPRESPEDRTLAGEIWPELERAIDPEPVIVLSGPDQATQRAAARLTAAHKERPLLRIDLAAVAPSEQSPRDAVELALRDARLTGAIPFLAGWDACLVDGAPAPSLLAALCDHPTLVIVAGKAAWQARGVDRHRAFLWIHTPAPSYPQRGILWRSFINQLAAEPELPVDDLAAQFSLTTDQIRDAVATARDIAARRGDTIRLEDLFAAARSHSNPRLSTLARKIAPRYTWRDLILPEDQLSALHEIVATVRERPRVLEEWGVGKKLASSNGITILFAGPPGTGKTMAAEVIAEELRLDLYKIDLSTVVSKYIGETEKNLERIFSEAQNSNAILFFDEADAIFGKRSEVKDAHDRYANIEVSYLLQRMEEYDGVTILATNLRANLDEAFTRRLQFAVDFPFPREEYRLRIWRTLFPPDVPRASDLDFALLARRFKLAGGSIRNVIVTAAFLAAAEKSPVTMAHLLHGARRELQKMGRLVDEADMAIDH